LHKINEVWTTKQIELNINLLWRNEECEMKNDRSIADLRNIFDAIASFYQIELGNKKYLCRNHAVIFRKGFANQTSPDAVIVMANPGSCNPNDSTYQPPIIDDIPMNLPYVVVKVDPTQRQLMKLMIMMNWNVVSIINLSDLCAGNMADFSGKLRQVGLHSFKNHTIFSEARKRERETMLPSTDSKIILAWGKHRSIKTLACESLKILSKELLKEKHILGFPYLETHWGYRHPYPMLKDRCEEWLGKMYQQLNKSDSETEIASTIDEENLEKCHPREKNKEFILPINK
jgi:hypothetical protein